MIPRDFFIEERLEKYRLSVSCNLGESGLRNFTLGEILNQLKISNEELGKISLADSPNNGREDLRIEIANLYENISPDQVLITTGTSTPAFQALYEIPIQLGTKVKEVEVRNFLPIQDLFSQDVKLAILNHPHNPTGIGIKEDEIKTLKDSITSFSGYTLFDEHYRFLDYHNDLSFSGAGLNGKTFNRFNYKMFWCNRT